MANIWEILTIILLVSTVNGATIKQVIDNTNDRPELIKLKEYMRDLPFYKNELGSNGDKSYTFFAPTNDAFENIPDQKKVRYNSGHITATAKGELNEIFKYHSAFHYNVETGIYDTYTTDEMKNKMVATSASGSPMLFFRTIGIDKFVNGARLLTYNIPAENGIVHIIDTFLYEEPVTTNSLQFLQDRISGGDPATKFSLFADLLREYDRQMDIQFPGDTHAEDVLNRPAPMTLFLPSDQALSKLSNKRQELKADFTKLQGVIESHVIKDGAYHTGILTQVETVSAMAGSVQVGSYLNRVYVSNNCAKGSITQANITVSNGAVHVIDGVLGYVYSDIYDTLSEYPDLQDFFQLVRGVTSVVEMIDIPDTTTDVAEEDLYTVFAPINSGMENSDFYGNERKETRVVKMHMLRGRLELASMTANLPRVPTLEDGESARFYQQDNNGRLETYVQVNYVRSRIIDGDICVKNGIVHTTDHIVGLPTTTILEYIEESEDLRSLYQAVRETGMDTVLNDEYKQQTFLAPSNRAFDEMSKHSEGSKLRDRSNRKYLKNVMLRQLISREYILDQIGGSGSTVGTEFNQETISFSRTGSNYTISFDQRRIPVKVSDLRMKNGMLHVIEEVLFSHSAGASEWISVASHLTPSSPALYCLLTLSLLLTATLCRHL